MSADARNYEDMTREMLIERLRRAEDVCVLVGWTGIRTGNDRDDALTQLWSEWCDLAGNEASNRSANPHLRDEAIHAIAERRRAIRQETITRLGLA